MRPIVTRVVSLPVTIPAFCSPTKALKRPMPAPKAFFSDSGMEWAIQVRTFVTVSKTSTMPSMKTAVRANRQS